MPLIQLEEGRLEYRTIEAGSKDRPALVFLHHGVGSVGLWRDFPERLCRMLDCRGLIYSRLGHGKSDPAEWPRPVSFLEDQGRHTLPALLAALGFDDVVLVGHSEGATIALVYAGTVRRGVRGVVAEAPHLYNEAQHTRMIGETRAAFRNTPLRDRLRRHHGNNVDSMFNAWAETWLQAGFQTWSVEHTIAGIECPVLAIRGTRDQYGTIAQVDRLRALARCPLEVRIIEAGHDPHEEMPEQMLVMMSEFIRGLPN